MTKFRSTDAENFEIETEGVGTKATITIDGTQEAEVDSGGMNVPTGNLYEINGAQHPHVEADITDLGTYAPAANGYPQRAVMWMDEVNIVTGNSLFQAVSTNQRYNSYSYQNVSANGDVFSSSFFLKAGTYTFFVLGATNNSQGKIDWAVDGVAIVSAQDWYSASLIYNVIKSTASITITGDGYHKITGTINGKNASSSNFYMTLTKFWFVPSTDPART